MSTQFRLKNVRLSYPHLFTAREYEEGDGKFRYSANFHVEKGSVNDTAIEKAIADEAALVYGKKAAQIQAWRDITQKFCYVRGAIRGLVDADDLMVFTAYRAVSAARPGVYDKDLSPLTEADGRPYAGCYVNAICSIWAQDGKNPGIRGSFLAVQFAADGDAFSSAPPPSADDFETLVDDDSIPF